MNLCESCDIEMTEKELVELKAATYDSIIAHLLESGDDVRRRERVRTKIALKNIKQWAAANLTGDEKSPLMPADEIHC
jgi:hypothetical protein